MIGIHKDIRVIKKKRRNKLQDILHILTSEITMAKALKLESKRNAQNISLSKVDKALR